ncbi:MAG: lamin tail domain-containing protein, partial [Planctomycetota bacterium]
MTNSPFARFSFNSTSTTARTPRPWALGLLAALATAGSASAQNVVISQVYGGGGDVTATHTNDFIELHNRTSASISLAGWSVQYAQPNGTTWFVTNLSGSIPANGYYLVAQASSGANGVALPTANATGTTNLSATSGKVALVNNTTALTGSGCPIAATVIDFVGYGAANCSEGTASAAGASNKSVRRASGGCSDSGNNSTDFSAVTPTPRNSSNTNSSAPSWFIDADGDGYGLNGSTAVLACLQPAGYVSVQGDCLDTNAAVYPGATELCLNGLDDDCDGFIDNPTTTGIYNFSADTYHCTLQAAVDLALPNDVIMVAAGTYAENVTINKAVVVSGPNWNVSPNSGTRAAEAIFVPATTDTSTGAVITITSSNVTFEGFTVDGDNTALASSDVGLGGALGTSIDAARAIFVNANGINTVNIAKNVTKNVANGIRLEQTTNYFASGGPAGAVRSTGIVVHDNLVQNTTGTGIRLGNSMYAKVTNNT